MHKAVSQVQEYLCVLYAPTLYVVVEKFSPEQFSIDVLVGRRRCHSWFGYDDTTWAVG